MYKKLLGAYRDKPSNFFYKLNPLAKLLLSLFLVISAGVVSDIRILIFLFIVVSIIFKFALFNNMEHLYIIHPFRFLLGFTLIVQLFVSSDGSFMVPSLEAFYAALTMTFRMVVIILLSSIFVLTTKPIDIVKVFNLLFKPLKLFKISPTDMAMSMLIALRFIPLLFREGEKIMDAQRLKGVVPLRGEKFTKLAFIRSSISLVIPLFVRTFNYSSQLAITLEFRKRDAKYFALQKFNIYDIIAITISLLISIGVIFVSTQI